MTGHDDAHPASTPQHPETLDLSELATRLIADLAHHPAGRAARTVLSGEVMRAVVIALREGVHLAEHDAPPAATLYCITGRVTLVSGEHRLQLLPGQLVPIPPARHAVEADADSAVLLTVALR